MDSLNLVLDLFIGRSFTLTSMTVPCIVRIIIFPVVFGSKLLSRDFEDVLSVTRNLFLMGRYGYEIMKNMGRV